MAGLGRSASPLDDPAIYKEPDGSLCYDTSSEPEAVGYQGIQPQALRNGASMSTAQARHTDTPCYAAVEGDHDDLLSGASKRGDQPE